MRLPPAAQIAALTLLLAGHAPSPARAQATLDAARGLYESAAYDDALAMLNGLPDAGLDAQARVSVDHYRMLCLLALGRTVEVDDVVASLLDRHPAYRISPDDTSPRVMKAFLDARRRALPRVARKRYEQARALYTSRDYAAAATEFGVVRALLADAEVPAANSPLHDLERLAADFEDLSRTAAAAEERKAAEARAAAEAAEKAREAEREEAARAAAAPPVPAPPPEPADGIYTAQDRGVVPPVAIRQDIGHWMGPTPRPPAGTPLGRIQVVIDERGAVIEAVMVASVSGFYDAVLMESVKSWRYQPATRDGRPVKFRRVLALSAG